MIIINRDNALAEPSMLIQCATTLGDDTGMAFNDITALINALEQASPETAITLFKAHFGAYCMVLTTQEINQRGLALFCAN